MPSRLSVRVLRGTGGIVGTVLDAYNKPIEGALVATDKQSALTDGRGHYALEKVPEGGHLLTAHKDGYTWQRSYVFVKTGGTTRVDFQVDRANAFTARERKDPGHCGKAR